MKISHKITLATAGIFLIASPLYYYVKIKSMPPAVEEVTSFNECVKAGYPVMESFPRKCKTSNGPTYTEELTQEQLDLQISYHNATSNDIVITNPLAGSVIGKSFRVTGKARGYWYFEASFPVRVLDSNGKTIASGLAQVGGDWMTADFISFISTELKLSDSYIGPATLVLQKDNPSGLQEKDASISIPFTIGY